MFDILTNKALDRKIDEISVYQPWNGIENKKMQTLSYTYKANKMNKDV